MMNKTFAWSLALAAVVAVTATVAIVGAHGLKVEVFTVTVPDLPFCDADHKTNCAATKINWNSLSAALSRQTK